MPGRSATQSVGEHRLVRGRGDGPRAATGVGAAHRARAPRSTPKTLSLVTVHSFGCVCTPPRTVRSWAWGALLYQVAMLAHARRGRAGCECRSALLGVLTNGGTVLVCIKELLWMQPRGVSATHSSASRAHQLGEEIPHLLGGAWGDAAPPTCRRCHRPWAFSLDSSTATASCWRPTRGLRNCSAPCSSR